MAVNKKNLFSAFLLLSVTLLALSLFVKKRKQDAIPTYRIIIVAAHNNKIKEVVIPYLQKKFRGKYDAKLEIEWAKFGGQNKNIKNVEVGFQSNNNQTSGFDIVWGGGSSFFHYLERKDFLQPFPLTPALRDSIPSTHKGVMLYHEKEGKVNMIAGCYSTFVILYNKPLFKSHNLPIPKSWHDLAKPAMYGELAGVDPTCSSSAWSLYALVLDLFGWEKGWQLLMKIAGNNVSFYTNSSAPPTAILQGNVLCAPCLGFYAQQLLAAHGEDQLAVAHPRGKDSMLNGDFIALLKGAPNSEKATFIIHEILSPDFQRLLMYKKESPAGPNASTLGRLAVNRVAYEGKKEEQAAIYNPYEGDDAPQKHVYLPDKQLYIVASEAYKAICIQAHNTLKQVVQLIHEGKLSQQEIDELLAPPFTYAEVGEIVAAWEKSPLTHANQTRIWSEAFELKAQKIIRRHTT